MNDLKRVRIYSDGAARGNPDGPGGYGAILQYTDAAGKLHEKELSEGFSQTTNNRMELMAAIQTVLEARQMEQNMSVASATCPPLNSLKSINLNNL